MDYTGICTCILVTWSVTDAMTNSDTSGSSSVPFSLATVIGRLKPSYSNS